MLVRGGWRDKRAYEIAALRLVTRRNALACRVSDAAQCEADAAAHCIVLHGWSLDFSGMSALAQALQQLPSARGRRFWDISYDTQWTPFWKSARDISRALREQPFAFSDVVLIGYSMGGVVARQMIADGFPCRALITICSPHHGSVPWLPSPGRGPRSIARWSPALRALNRNKVDAAARSRYHFFAVTYQDRLGRHEHDGIVPLRSALGEGLGAVAQREKVLLKYATVAAYDPHWRGKDPRYMAPVLETAAQLFENATT